MQHLKIGTRKSPLALYQAKLVANYLEDTGKCTTELVCYHTKGDKNQDQCLTEIGGKGVFTEEIECALRENLIDIAVHSLKDLPVPLASDFKITAVLSREDPRDAFLSKQYSSFRSVPEKGVIGTSSIRRRAFLKRLKPNLQFLPLRGNIETRYRKTCNGNYSGSIMAYAACKRLQMTKCCRTVFSLEEMLPAPGQGIIAIESLKDSPLKEVMAIINHSDTFLSSEVERRVLDILEGGCQTPIGAICQCKGQEFFLSIGVVHPDGEKHCFVKKSGLKDQWRTLTDQAVEQLLRNGAKEIIKEATRN